MFLSAYSASMFIVLHFFIKSSAGANHEPNGLEKFFGDESNFIIKAKLSFNESENERNWLIEESILGDEKNIIVTLITKEKEGIQIEVFRDFKTQTISLVCVQNNCDRNGQLWHLNRIGGVELLDIFLKQILLMGPYRMISYFVNETTNQVEKSDIEGFHRLHLKFDFSDTSSKILMRRKNSGRISIRSESYTPIIVHFYPDPEVVLSIMEIEPLESSMVSSPSKYIHYKYNESITRYNGLNKNETTTYQYIITLLDSASSLKIIGEQTYRELIHDYKSGSKYISSGFNECTVELSNDKINYMTSEKYGVKFVKELYFPESNVESSKLGMKVEYNKLIDNVEYDCAVTTYLYGSSRIGTNIADILKDFCVLLNLYSKLGSHKFDLIEVRKKCFTGVIELSAEDELPQMVAHDANACFKDRNDKIILDLKVAILDRSTSKKIHVPPPNIQNIEHELRTIIMNKLSISYLRINLSKFDFFDDHIMAKVEIVESFVTHFKTKIQGTSHRLRIKPTGSGLYLSTIDECVRLQSSKAKNKFIITCKTGDYLCLGIAHENSLPVEDTNGLNCMLFNISIANLDVSLKEIQKSYSNLNGSQFYHFDGSKFVIVGVTNLSPEKSPSSIISKYFYLFTIFLFTITIIFCLFMRSIVRKISIYQISYPLNFQ